MNKNKSADEFRIVIQNQSFLTEKSLNLAEYGAGGFFTGICFVNCTFKKVELPGALFGCCSFQNCRFYGFFNRKGTFTSCCFKDCKIKNSNLSRLDCQNTGFEDCEFVGVDLAASDIYSCTFKGTRFLKSNLQLIAVDNVTVWESNEWVKIEDYSNFEKHLDTTDMVTEIYLDFDFKVEGPAPWEYVYVKSPVGSEVLRRQNQTISLEDMAYNLGKKIVFEKQRFVGLVNGPQSSENVGHIIDLYYVPIHEKSIVRENILQGARDRGSDEGIRFLNDK